MMATRTSLLLLPFTLSFRLLFWCITFVFGRILKFVTRKGFLYFSALPLIVYLDQILPIFDGKITPTVLILGPGVLIGLYVLWRQLYNGKIDEYKRCAFAMLLIGALGLIRAWSAAADTSVAAYLGTLSRIVFGTAFNIGVGIWGSMLGISDKLPMPMLHSEGIWVQFSRMNLLLTSVSLVVILWAVAILARVSLRYGQLWSRRSKHDRRLARNRFLPTYAVNAKAVGGRRNLVRNIANVFQPPRICFGETVVGMAESGWKRPLSWPLYALHFVLNTLLALRLEGSLLDPRPLLVVKSIGALHFGGRGTGKSLRGLAHMCLSDSPTLSIDTQMNAVDKEIPISLAKGRIPIVFAPDQGLSSASLNVLAGLDPDAHDFALQIKLCVEVIIDRSLPMFKELGVLVDISIELLEVAIANCITLGREQMMDVNLRDVYHCLIDADLAENLANWALHGHPDFRSVCSVLSERLQKEDYRDGMMSILNGQLRFLDLSAGSLVCGETNSVFDPKRLLSDAKLDVIISVDERMVIPYGALIRLLLAGVTAPRWALNEAEAKRAAVPGLTIYVDELNALAGTKILNDIVVYGRQVGFAYIYCSQGPKQVEQGFGEGTLDTWVNSSDLIIIGRFKGEETDAFARQLFAKTVQMRRVKSGAGDWQNEGQDAHETDLLGQEYLERLSKLHYAVFAESKDEVIKFICETPAFFKHPGLKSFLKRARRLTSKRQNIRASLTTRHRPVV